MADYDLTLRILRSDNPRRKNRRFPRSRVFGFLIIILAFSAVFSSGQIPLVRAATSTSWNTRVQCTPLIVRITDITANHTGSASFSASPFTPGITTSVTGGVAKRWLTPGPTPTGWASPGPSCTVTNSKGMISVFIEIDGIERSSLTTEDSATSYDATNGGTSHPTTYDTTTNLIDPAIVPNYDTSCTSPSDPTCYGRIHGEIDHDWKAAGYCGSGTACDQSALASQTSRASTKIDVQGFIYWDPGRETSQGHNYNGWEIHPLTGWRLHQSNPDFSVSTNPSSLSFGSGATGSFTTTISGQNGFTGSVTISTSVNPTTGLSVSCNPTNISGGAGSSTCTVNSSTPGSYNVTVTGTSGSLDHSASVSVTVTKPPSPDFAIGANPSTLTIVQGRSGTSTMNLSSINGYSGTISLSAYVSPSGPSANLHPATIALASNGAGSSTLNVTSNTSPLGSYSVNVTGTSGSLSHSAIVTVSVTGQPDFTVSANPSSLTLGQPSPTTVTPVTVTTSSDRTWFESSYLADSFAAQGLIWMFFEDSALTCENQSGCLLYTTSSTGSSWASPINLNVHVTDSDFSVYTDGSNVYYARYNEATFQSDCGRNLQFRTGNFVGASGTINWQPEQTALKAGSAFTYQNEEIIIDSNGQAWIAFLSDSRGACGGDGTELPQIIHSSGTNYASWTTPTTLSTAHSNNWHIALASLGTGQIYAAYWLANNDMHGKLYNGSTWGSDEQISATTTKNDVNAWLFNSGTNLYAIYFDNNPETFNFASRSSTGAWTSNIIGVGEARTGTSFSSSYYAFPDAASYDPTHNKFYLFWMNATNQRIDQWTGSGNSWTKTTKLIGTTAVPYPDGITSFITSSPTNSFPTTGGIFYVSGSSAPFTYNFAALPLGPSSTGTFTVTVTSQNGFTGTINLTTSVNPSTGLTVTCSPTILPGGSGSSTCTVNSATPGNYNVTITGTSGALSHSATVYVSVTQSASPDFKISASPTSATVSAGDSGSSTISVAPLNGFAGTVTLTPTTNSTNLVCTLSSTSITGGSGTSTLSCHGSPAGNYLATVTGTSGSLSHSAAVTYHVQDFTIAAAPLTVTVNAESAGTSSITVTELNGFAGVVSLATNSTSCTVSPTSITGSGSATLSCTFSAASTVHVGITGTSGSLSHSVTVTYILQDFTITASPTSVTVNAGSAGTSTITVSPLNGFTGTVALTAATNSTNMSCGLSSTSIGGASGTSTLSCSANIPGNYLATVTGTSGSLSHSASEIYHVTAAPDFSISANPTSVTANAGATGISTITVSPLNGFTGTVTLTITTNSTNLSCNLSPTTIPGGSGTSTLSCTGSVPSNYLATVTGNSGSQSHIANVIYRTQDFTISANPTSVNVSVGVAGSSTITVAPLNGFSGTVALSVTTNSSNLVCVLSSSGITGGSGTATLSCNGSLPGNYLATVTGTNSSLTHTTSVTYHITALPIQDFTISASPTTVTVNSRGIGNSTITVAPVNGFSGTVTLSVTTNSTNLVCTLSPTRITGGSGSSTLSCQGSPASNYQANVTGTSNSLTHTTSVKYRVQDFTITASPASVSTSVGVAATSTITVTGLNGFSGTVTLATSVTPSTGLSANCNPSSIPGSGSSTCTFNSSTAGNYTVTVTSTSGTLSHSLSLTVSVRAVGPSISTTLSSTSIQVGQSVTDSATLQGVTATASGTVSYLDYGVGNCGAAATLVSVVTVTNGVVPNSRPVMFNFTGSFSFQAKYSGDPNNVAATSPCEPLTVTPAPPRLTTTLSATSITVGGSVSDSASLTTSCTDPACMSEVAANGTVTYSLFPSGACAGAGSVISTVNVINNGRYNIVPSSRSVIFNSTGSFAFNAAYSGDTNGNAAVTSPCEPLTVNKTTPTITTNLSSSKVSAGGSVTDSATLTLAVQAGGTATYNLFSTGDCSGTSTIVSTVVVTNGAVPNSASRTFNTPGNYSWNAVYSGDSNNNGATSSCEPLVVNSSTTTPPSYALVVSYEGFVYRLYPNGTLSLIGQPATTQLRAVSWTPDGSYALIVGDHAVLVKYDGTSLTTIPTGIATTINFLSIAWRPDGSYALVGGSGGILLKYDGTTVTQIPSSYAVSFRAISWNPSGTQALLVSYFGQVFQYQSTEQLTKLNSGASQSFDAVAWSPDGSYALIAGDGGGILKHNGTAFQALNTAGLYSSTLTVRFISFNPAGNLALLVGDSGLVLTYNGSSLSALPTLTSNTLYSVSWAAGTAYIVGGAGAMLTYSGGTLKNVPTGTFSGFRGIAWKP